MASKNGSRSFYAVKVGRQPGIFMDWNACNSQVKGFSGAIYKKFGTLYEAEKFIGMNHSKRISSFTSGRGTSINAKAGVENNNDKKPVEPLQAHVSKRKYEDTDSFSSDDELLRVLKKGSKNISKFYAVKSNNKEVKSKIFENWKQCKKYVHGVKGLTFKSFTTWIDAKNFIADNFENPVFDYKLLSITQEEFESNVRNNKPKFKYGKDIVKVYCDGSSLSNGKSFAKAGAGAFFDHPELHKYNISEPLNKNGAQTNNRAEAVAIYKALLVMEKILIHEKCCTEFKIYSDSEYVAKLLNDRYKMMNVGELQKLPNSDILLDLIKQFIMIKRYYFVNKDVYDNEGKFKIHWVKGHSGDYGNEMADKLAKEGAMKLT